MLVLFRAPDPRAWSGAVGCFVHSVIQGHGHVKGLSGNTTVHGRWGGSRRCAKFCLKPTQVCLLSQIKGTTCFLNFSHASQKLRVCGIDKQYTCCEVPGGEILSRCRLLISVSGPESSLVNKLRFC